MVILKRTQSVCPECYDVLSAFIVEEKGKVYLVKECPKHGPFREIYWSDAKLYKWADSFLHNGNGIENPAIKKNKPVCPKDCGLCKSHLSGTCLANLFVTNRCDMRCFYCFANVGKAGKVFEPTMKELDFMLKALRNEKPVATKAIQITGGEPTMRKDLIGIIKLCKKRGFTHIQVNSNGINLGFDPSLAKKIRAAGCNTVYLSFDSLVAKMKGGGTEYTMKAIENCRRAKMGVVLVPCVIGDYNLREVGDIIRFAVKNIDVVRGINFQPVSFVGNITSAERKKKRVTIPDLLKAIEKQTYGDITVKDFYPVSSVVSVSHLASALSRKPELEITANPHCGAATYLCIEDGKIIPITKFMNVEKLFDFAEQAAQKIKNGGKLTKAKVMLQGYFALKNMLNREKKPKGFELDKILFNVLMSHDYKTLGTFHYKTLFIGTMHFMDAYNYDIERVKRCVIHYVMPDGKIVPFCAFNGLPGQYLMKMQKDYGIPIKEWERKTGKKLNDEIYRPKN